ncbi:hypothetical protein RXV91_04300 [Lactiplantibacillus sp. DA1]|uniref:hypothetical protein n=1 Tax=Lactiplantibacillus sp. DA1 TaxID=3079857 RepID=UPI00292A5FF3|nr:hypothetical protein [Lactiplantibacillus sp. DA1]MDV0430105.1 hypothetical protein [Lactiplantibacillus sp. DA1]
MSDVVLVALISAGASIIVALITQAPAILNRTKATDNTLAKLKKDNEALQKENTEKQEIIEYYRKRDEK